MTTTGFLPITREEMEDRGITQPDFVYVTGDAYVDHPSFGHAIITRILEAHGYSVCIISQPDWKDEKSISIFGCPRLGFLVSSGNMDSMVNHYFVSRKRRPSDAYTPGGEAGKRPDHATVVYCNLIRRVYRTVPVIIGGIEASLRRMAHYDYWSDSFKRSILLDSQADLISYGMGEKSIVEIADALNSGIEVKDISFIPGTVYKTKDISGIYDGIILPSYEDMKEDKKNTRKALWYSIPIRILLTGRLCWKDIREASMWYRTLLRSPFPQKKWMPYMPCLICAPIIRLMKRRAAFLRSVRLSFP